jgi:hypothetical protein
VGLCFFYSPLSNPGQLGITSDLPYTAADGTRLRKLQGDLLANEAGHFPVGYEGLFSEWLTSGKSLVVVIETDGRVVAFGGINAMQRK